MSTQNTATPWEFFYSLEDFLGIKIKYDMAACLWNTKCTLHFTAADDSLSIDWPRDGWIWLNPNFEIMKYWVPKITKEYFAGSKIVTIWPISTDKHQIPACRYANEFKIFGRVWPNVRGTVVHVWDLCAQLVGPTGLLWDKKTGTLTQISKR